MHGSQIESRVSVSVLTVTEVTVVVNQGSGAGELNQNTFEVQQASASL